MEACWDGSYVWSVGMKGYRLFRKNRLGRQGRGIAIYDKLENLELFLGTGDGTAESLRVRVKGRRTVMGEHYSESLLQAIRSRELCGWSPL